MEKIILLDFCTAEVVIRDYPEGLEDSSDWFETEFNDVELREKDCQYMVVRELKINIK